LAGDLNPQPNARLTSARSLTAKAFSFPKFAPIDAANGAADFGACSCVAFGLVGSMKC
jgi:hypothetical protein